MYPNSGGCAVDTYALQYACEHRQWGASKKTKPSLFTFINSMSRETEGIQKEELQAWMGWNLVGVLTTFFPSVNPATIKTRK